MEVHIFYNLNEMYAQHRGRREFLIKLAFSLTLLVLNGAAIPGNKRR